MPPFRAGETTGRWLTVGPPPLGQIQLGRVKSEAPGVAERGEPLAGPLWAPRSHGAGHPHAEAAREG